MSVAAVRRPTERPTTDQSRLVVTHIDKNERKAEKPAETAVAKDSDREAFGSHFQRKQIYYGQPERPIVYYHESTNGGRMPDHQRVAAQEATRKLMSTFTEKS